MFGLGAGEMFLILVFALIVLGPKKLPELAKALGKGIREFQKAKDGMFDSTESESIAPNSAPPLNQVHGTQTHKESSTPSTHQ